MPPFGPVTQPRWRLLDEPRTLARIIPHSVPNEMGHPAPSAFARPEEYHASRQTGNAWFLGVRKMKSEYCVALSSSFASWASQGISRQSERPRSPPSSAAPSTKAFLERWETAVGAKLLRMQRQ